MRKQMELKLKRLEEFKDKAIGYINTLKETLINENEMEELEKVFPGLFEEDA